MSKIVLITGSSRGIGAAIAARLVGAGWRVILHSNRTDLSDQAKELGSGCLGWVNGDLESPAETAEIWRRAKAIGEISALVNNAGIYIPCAFTSPESEDVQRQIFRVNFEAPVELMRAAVSEFERKGSGKVLNVASRVGFRGEAGAAMYAASKAALINLTRSLAVEYAGRGIEFMGIAPGWVDTSMSRDGMEDRLPEILAGIPAGRMASPEDCAAATEFLLSDAASYLTGTVIDINGASYFH